MNDDNLITVSCKLNPDTVAAIEREAEKAAMSRSEYLRTLILSSMAPGTPGQKVVDTRDPTILLYQILYGIDRVHNGMYKIAHIAKALTPQQLKELFEETTHDGIDFLSTIDERITKTRRQLAERLATAPPPAVGK
jgi:hypothetical protein